MPGHDELLSRIEELVRAGHSGDARRSLQKLHLKGKLPRPVLLPFASLARRAGAPSLGLRILNPVVRSSAKKPAKPSPEEKAEYAACLIRVGAAQEALEILDALSPKDPQVLLFRAYGLFPQWRYEEAIPILSKFLETTRDPYQRLVGQTNLVAALIFTREYRLAEMNLAELRRETRERGLVLLLGNALELSAQVGIFQRRWEVADRYLAEAAKLLGASGAVEELFVAKWRAVSALLRDPSKANRAALRKVRTLAVGRHHWETVRECDLFLAVATEDEPLLEHLYFGTPYDGYRRRIFRELGRPLRLPDRFAWSPGGGRGGVAYDLLTAKGAARAGLKPGQLLHRMIRALSRDFYRAPRLAELHATVFPEAHFNPVSSPLRVHQALRRLKRWLEKRRIPLRVTEARGAYRLEAAKPCVLWIARWEGSNSLGDFRLILLREKFGTEFFSLAQAGRVLKLSPRMALRVVNGGIDSGSLERQGASSAVRYRLV